MLSRKPYLINLSGKVRSFRRWIVFRVQKNVVPWKIFRKKEEIFVLKTLFISAAFRLHKTLQSPLQLCVGDTLIFFLFLNLFEKAQKLMLLCYSKNSLYFFNLYHLQMKGNSVKGSLSWKSGWKFLN